ncbi:MAG: glucose-1-phosphate cytidylyltransferase [Vampirovibrionales bacterium]|jgi:glucose-1-phosphate cytidylyltransferase
MKVVLLAGGYGTRISEESSLKPKPMIEIGGKPILWHIMKIYSHYGFNDFVILLGYKSYLIKEYFANYFLHQSDITIDLEANSIQVHQSTAEKWKITLVDTGIDTMTGGRLKRAKAYIGDAPFLLTYGDGVADVDIDALVQHHKDQGKIATVTAVMPVGRFGALALDDHDAVTAFHEKPKGDGAWINGGFFVLEPAIFKYLSGDACIFEKEPLESVAKAGQLSAFKHEGFWKPMDTLRDKTELEALWASQNAPWKLW